MIVEAKNQPLVEKQVQDYIDETYEPSDFNSDNDCYIALENASRDLEWNVLFSDGPFLVSLTVGEFSAEF